MKKGMLLVLTGSVIIATVASTGCGITDSLADVVSKTDSTSFPEGDDYIEYYYDDRDELLDDYVGDKLDADDADVLLENVSIEYYENDDGTYQCYIYNNNSSYYFDGVVELSTSEGENIDYIINVEMIAPGNYEYFDIDLDSESDDYLYHFEGDMYEVKEDLEIDYSFYEAAVSSDSTDEGYTVIDADEVTMDDANAFADYYYAYDAIYNYMPITYYLVTQTDYESTNDMVYTYSLSMDPENHSVEIYDNTGTLLDTKTY